MFRKNCVTRPTSAAHTNTSPTCEAMYGKRMNSPLASPTPAAMMPGPMIRQVDRGGSGNGRISGLARYFAGNRSATEVVTSLCCLVMCLRPLSCMLYAKGQRGSSDNVSSDEDDDRLRHGPDVRDPDDHTVPRHRRARGDAAEPCGH